MAAREIEDRGGRIEAEARQFRVQHELLLPGPICTNTMRTAATAAVPANASKGFATVTTLKKTVNPVRNPDIVQSFRVRGP